MPRRSIPEFIESIPTRTLAALTVATGLSLTALVGPTLIENNRKAQESSQVDSSNLVTPIQNRGSNRLVMPEWMGEIFEQQEVFPWIDRVQSWGDKVDIYTFENNLPYRARVTESRGILGRSIPDQQEIKSRLGPEYSMELNDVLNGPVLVTVNRRGTTAQEMYLGVRFNNEPGSRVRSAAFHSRQAVMAFYALYDGKNPNVQTLPSSDLIPFPAPIAVEIPR